MGGSGDSGVGFLNQFRAALRQWWYIVAASILALGVIAMCASLFQSPVYEARATVYVTAGSDGNSSAAYQGSLASQQRIASYSELATSDVVLGDAIEDQHLSMSISAARSAVLTESSKDSMLLSVGAMWSDPLTAGKLVDGVVQALSDKVRQLETPSVGGEPAARLTVVSPGAASYRPVSPLIWRNTLVGMIFGFLLAIAIISYRARFSGIVRTLSDAQQCEGVSALGSVVSDEGVGESGWRDERSHIGALEGLRRIRIALSFLNVDSPPRCILVSSAIASEGKTTFALGLAGVLAESGDSVVIVDADLRRPRVAERLCMSGEIGVTDYLKGTVSLDDVLQSVTSEGFVMLASGSAAPNPGGLLESDRFEQLIDDLRSRFTYIIIDSAPVLPVSDSLATSSSLDAVVLVARAEVTRVSDLVACRDLWKAAGIGLIGSVVTDCPRGLVNGYYSGYSYQRRDSLSDV